ncbi:hypothetical protein ACS0TY_014509 [Phlomoides rotata]
MILSMYSLAVVVIALVLGSLRSKKLPPGPYPFPIIGNILQLGPNPHQSFANPLMYLQLGRLCAVVVSSPEMAKQVLHEHDQALSNTETHDVDGPPEFNDRFTRRKQMAESSKNMQRTLILGSADRGERRASKGEGEEAVPVYICRNAA